MIFQENISFDHYFATYPFATNPGDEPPFFPAPGTPTVNGLTPALLSANPNFLNGANNDTTAPVNSIAANPFRLDRSQAATADQDHDYTPEQMAFDSGLMDLFPLSVGTAGPPPGAPPAAAETQALTMGYYDGNTVTALWNYAQFFAMNDNSYDTNFGPSTPGALNLISGQTNGAINNIGGTGSVVDDGFGGLTVVSDSDPIGDVCSTSSEQFQMSGPNIGEALSAANVTWGFFEGGFDLTITNSNGTTACKRSTTSAVTNVKKLDYIPHHQPFQYYAATANPTHARPTSAATIGHNGDPANHQYDINDFFSAVEANNFPAVSFLKASGFQDGHAGYSDPLDEQTFVVNVINFLEQQPQWRSTLVIIAYDDSDGWYDHQMSPIMNQSTTSMDALTGDGQMRKWRERVAGRRSGNHARARTLRLRTQNAIHSDLALCEVELRRSHGYRSDLDHPVHRGQLAQQTAPRPGIVRRDCGTDQQHARLQTESVFWQCGLPRPEHRRRHIQLLMSAAFSQQERII